MRHLRVAARRSIEPYGLVDARLTFIGHSENATYRVDVPGSRYLLRMHIPHHPGAVCAGMQTERMIASELTWLAALRTDAGLAVPEPVADSTGELVRLVTVEGEAAPVPVTLMRWQPGRFPGSLTPGQCRSAGALMARLHQHSSGWVPPRAFQRPDWDAASFQNALEDMQALIERSPPGLALTAAQLACFRESAERVAETTRDQGTGSEEWGLIHADLHPGNLLFHRGEARAIDFSRCGFGHFIYDMAECCRFLSPEKRRAFAVGYRRIRLLPENYHELLEAFFVRGWIEIFAFPAPNPREPERLRAAVPPFVERLENAYLKGETFVTR